MSNIVLAAGGDDGYQISRSVRLRSSASAYFNRTASGFGASTQTMSFWFKRGNVSGSAVNPIRSSFYDANNYSVIAFDVTAGRLTILQVEGGATVCSKVTDAVYRDPSAWYHVVINTDLSRSSGDKNRIYVNGVLQTCTGTDNQTYQLWPYTAYTQVIGYAWASGTYLDGYLTEVNFIDGQALTPSSFGETDSITGVWKPKKYAGTYGTNGFFLNFSNAASTTTIGYDYSGNGNNWTSNNISVTSGVTYDSMIDSPTMYADGGNGRGNYCTFNPLAVTSVAATFAEGNLKVTTGAAGGNGYGTMAIPASGKWYWEITFSSGSDAMVGLSAYLATQTYAWQNGNSVFYYNDGQKYVDGGGASYGATYTTGDVIGVAVDAGAGTVTFYKNNTSQGSITHAVTDLLPCVADGSASFTATYAANFGQRPFAYTPPTGFKALNTQNLPDATIKKGNAWFDATTYTGNGGTLAVTNSGGFQPDWIWVKSRNTAQSNYSIDSVRGINNILVQNNTEAESYYDATWRGLYGNVSAINSNGFTVVDGTDPTFDSFNGSTDTYVAWQWKESASAGFDIVTWTGNGTARTIAHNLGVTPSMFLVKRRDAAGSWRVFHNKASATPQNGCLFLEGTQAFTTTTIFNNTAPTSTTFAVGTDPDVNANGGTYVAYLFSEVAGYSKFGSYTGNGSADGPFVYLGFRPKFVLIKNASGAYTWITFDSARGTYNVNGQQLYPNTSDAEATDNVNNCMDFLSNGFKFRGASAVGNGSGNTIIYAAFAENPFKNSLAR